MLSGLSLMLGRKSTAPRHAPDDNVDFVAGSSSLNESLPDKSSADKSLTDKSLTDNAKASVNILNIHAQKTALTRTSPRKRKALTLDRVQAVMKPSKLRRVTSDSLPVNTRAVPRPREDLAEMQMSPTTRPEEPPQPKSPAQPKKKELKRSRRRDVTPPLQGIGVGDISVLPATDSPAKHTRSHDQKKPSQPARASGPQKVQRIGNGHVSGKEAANQGAEADGHAEDAVDEQDDQEPEGRERGHRPEQISLVKKGRGQPRKSLNRDVRTLLPPTVPATEDNAQVDVEDTEPRHQPRPSRTVRKDKATAESVLEGIEEAAQLYGCRSSWANMFLAAKPIVRERIDKQFHQAMKYLDQVKNVRAAYRQLEESGDNGKRRDQCEADIANGIREIDTASHDLHATETQEHDSVVQEMYQQALLRLLPMLRLSLAMRCKIEPLEPDALDEIITILDIALQLVDGAGRKHGNGKRFDKSFAAIRRELRVIRKRYGDAMYAIDYEITSIQRAEDIAKKRADLKEWQQREHERTARSLQARRNHWQSSLVNTNNREARRLMSKLGIQPEPIVRPPAGAKTQGFDVRIFDVDGPEFDFDNITPPPLPPPPPSSKPTRTTTHRPPLPRLPTEEIPGPTADEWTEEEDIALLNGLQEFTGPDRYEEILYSSYADVLLRGGDHGTPTRDVDDLMRRALYHKQAMATRMREQKDLGEWEWLASVEG